MCRNYQLHITWFPHFSFHHLSLIYACLFFPSLNSILNYIYWSVTFVTLVSSVQLPICSFQTLLIADVFKCFFFTFLFYPLLILYQYYINFHTFSFFSAPVYFCIFSSHHYFSLVILHSLWPSSSPLNCHPFLLCRFHELHYFYSLLFLSIPVTDTVSLSATLMHFTFLACSSFPNSFFFCRFHRAGKSILSQPPTGHCRPICFFYKCICLNFCLIYLRICTIFFQSFMQFAKF